MTDFTVETRRVAEKWGFGMAPPKLKVQATRTKACETFLEIMSSRKFLEFTRQELEAISTVKGMFNRTVKKDQWDWFSVLAQLGYPSIGIARVTVSELTRLRSSMKVGDRYEFENARINLRRMPTRKCLYVFLGRMTITSTPGSGWVYVLSTREFDELLKIGMTRRTVQERVSEINQATGVAIPFGVRRCWHVRNPELVEKLLHKELDVFRFRRDREFFRISFHDAERILNSVIRHNKCEIGTLNILGNST